MMPLFVALLLPPAADAQFLGNIAKMSPKQIVGAIQQSKPQEIVDSLSSKDPKAIAKKAMESTGSNDVAGLQDTAAKEAAQVIKQGSGEGAEAIREAKEAAKAIKESGKETVKAALSELQNVTGSIVGPGQAPAPAAPSGPATSVPEAPKSVPEATVPDASNPHKRKVVGALQGLGDVIQKAGDVINQTGTSEVEKVLNGTNPQKVADAIKGAIPALPKSIPDALDPEKLKKAQSGLQDATKAIQSSPHVEQIKNKGQDFVSRLGFASAKSVESAIKGSNPDVAKALERSKADTKKMIEDNVPKVVHAISTADPDKVRKVLDDVNPQKVNQVLDTVDRVEHLGSGFPWAIVGVVVTLAVLACGGWHLMSVFKRRDVRSPTLLVDADINMWSRPNQGQRGNQSQASEEPLFRKF